MKTFEGPEDLGLVVELLNQLPDGNVKKVLAETHARLLVAALMNFSPEQIEQVTILEARFRKNEALHPNIEWTDVLNVLTPKTVDTLIGLEARGGQPDVIDEDDEAFFFGEVSLASPMGPEGEHRNIAFDKTAADSVLSWAKEEKLFLGLNGNAMEILEALGVEAMTVEQFLKIRQVMPLDKETQSWLRTPKDVSERQLAAVSFWPDEPEVIGVCDRYEADEISGIRGVRAVLRVPKKKA